LYAVGDNGTIVIYDGGWSWSTETAGITKNLNGIWGTADNNVYAVGDGGTILHSSDGGATWNQVGGGLTPANLNGICGTSDNEIWIVGDMVSDRPIVLEYDGSAWSKFPDAGIDQPYQNLKAVWGDSTSGFFAVGDEGTILNYNPYNSARWLAMDSPTAVNLRDVYGTSDGAVFAVGESVLKFGVQQPPVALKWTSKDGWVKMTMDPELMRDLSGVWGGSSDDVYAVGEAESNFMFFMSVSGTVYFAPANNGQFVGGIAGGGEIDLQPNQTLAPPMDIGEPSFPQYRYMAIETYVINMG